MIRCKDPTGVAVQSVNGNIAHISVELHHNDRFCIDCINCTAVDKWKKCTKLMAVATQFVEK